MKSKIFYSIISINLFFLLFSLSNSLLKRKSKGFENIIKYLDKGEEKNKDLNNPKYKEFININLPGIKDPNSFFLITEWFPTCIPEPVKKEMARLLVNSKEEDKDYKFKEIIDYTMNALNDDDCILIPIEGFKRKNIQDYPPVIEKDPCDDCPTEELRNKIIKLKNEYEEIEVPEPKKFNVPEEDKRPKYTPKEFNFDTNIKPCDGCGYKITPATFEVPKLEKILKNIIQDFEYTCDKCNCVPFNGGAGLVLLDNKNNVVFYSEINSLQFIQKNNLSGDKGERLTKIQLTLPKEIPKDFDDRRRWLPEFRKGKKQKVKTYDILADRQADRKFSFIKIDPDGYNVFGNVIGLYIKADKNGPEQLKGELYFGGFMNEKDIEDIKKSFQIY